MGSFISETSIITCLYWKHFHLVVVVIVVIVVVVIFIEISTCWVLIPANVILGWQADPPVWQMTKKCLTMFCIKCLAISVWQCLAMLGNNYLAMVGNKCLTMFDNNCLAMFGNKCLTLSIWHNREQRNCPGQTKRNRNVLWRDKLPRKLEWEDSPLPVGQLGIV